MIFGDILQELRMDLGLTQEDLAIKLNVSRAAISRYETSESEPNLDFLINCSEFFNVSIDYLLGKSRIQTPHNILSLLDKLNNISHSDATKLNYILQSINNDKNYIDLIYTILTATNRFNTK